MTAPSAQHLRDHLNPLFTDAGWTVGDFPAATAPDGMARLYIEDRTRYARITVVQGPHNSPHGVEALTVVVSSVEQAAAVLRAAGYLPAAELPSADRIAQAIGDPGSIVGNRIHTSFGDDRDESITRWSTRAVLAVLTGAATDPGWSRRPDGPANAR